MKQYKLSFVFLAVLYLAFSSLHAATEECDYLQGIDSSILLISGHDEETHHGLNSVYGSAYQLLNQAKQSILTINYAYSDPAIIEILNRKAEEGIEITVVYDRNRCINLPSLLHPSIKTMTRTTGEGHMHHKIVVVDHEYNWISSANFNNPNCRNLAIACRNQEMAALIYKESDHIHTQESRECADPFTTLIDSQRLELYMLPHNDPQKPKAIESRMNAIAKEKLLTLINEAEKSIRVSMIVWTYKDCARALVQAAKRGVNVEVVYANIDTEVLMILKGGNISLHKAEAFHHKMMEIDDKLIWTGSANWTMNAFSRTDDSVTVLYNLKPEQITLMNEAWTDLISISNPG